jgi:rhodanese-related sulfurtransferase
MENHVQLVDVRTPEEYRTGHIAYAVNIDVKQPDFKDKALRKLDRKQRTYVYCKTGIMRAANLEKRGIQSGQLDRGLQEYNRGILDK